MTSATLKDVLASAMVYAYQRLGEKSILVPLEDVADQVAAGAAELLREEGVYKLRPLYAYPQTGRGSIPFIPLIPITELVVVEAPSGRLAVCSLAGVCTNTSRDELAKIMWLHASTIAPLRVATLRKLVLNAYKSRARAQAVEAIEAIVSSTATDYKAIIGVEPLDEEAVEALRRWVHSCYDIKRVEYEDHIVLLAPEPCIKRLAKMLPRHLIVFIDYPYEDHPAAELLRRAVEKSGYVVTRVKAKPFEVEFEAELGTRNIPS